MYHSQPLFSLAYEMNKYSQQYKLLLTTQQNTNIPYNWPTFLTDTHLYMH